MIYILVLIVGFFFGILIKEIVPKFIEKYLITHRNLYKVRFNVNFVIHRYESNINEIVKTDSIEISISAKNEEEASSLATEIIEDDIRIEIEDVKLIK